MKLDIMITGIELPSSALKSIRTNAVELRIVPEKTYYRIAHSTPSWIQVVSKEKS